MKLSKTILILALLTVSSFGMSATVLAQDENASVAATEAFDQAVINTIDVNVISGDFNFDSLPGFDPDEVLNEDDAVLDNIMIDGNPLLNNFEILNNPQSEYSLQK